MMIFLSGIIYILLIFVLSIKEKEIELTDFEIQRRISNGEKKFEKIWLKKQVVPIFNRFRNFASVFLAIVLALSNSQFLKFGEAFLATIIMAILAFAVSRADFLRSFSHKFFKKISPKLYLIWNFLSLKMRKRILKLNKPRGWMFYSKDEMFDFLSKHKQIVSEKELEWFERVSSLASKKVADLMIPFEDLDILHEKDLLTPLVIDELFKSKQSAFVVMDEKDSEVLGLVKMEKIAEIAGDSKRVRTVMEREVFTILDKKPALEVFEKMLKEGQNFAIVNTREGELVGVVEFDNLF